MIIICWNITNTNPSISFQPKYIFHPPSSQQLLRYIHIANIMSPQVNSNDSGQYIIKNTFKFTIICTSKYTFKNTFIRITSSVHFNNIFQILPVKFNQGNTRPMKMKPVQQKQNLFTMSNISRTNTQNNNIVFLPVLLFFSISIVITLTPKPNQTE